MKQHPTNIELAGEGALLIQWSDGMRRRYEFRELADACPCATCREAGLARAESLPIVSLEETPPPKLRAITPVGNYAYRIEFEGGCTTGIYRLDYLRRLGAVVE